MNELLLVPLGLLVVLITKVLKDKGLTQKQAAIVITIIAAIGYSIYTQFVPEEIQSQIVLFVSSVVGIGKIIYDVISTLMKEREGL